MEKYKTSHNNPYKLITDITTGVQMLDKYIVIEKKLQQLANSSDRHDIIRVLGLGDYKIDWDKIGDAVVKKLSKLIIPKEFEDYEFYIEQKTLFIKKNTPL